MNQICVRSSGSPTTFETPSPWWHSPVPAWALSGLPDFRGPSGLWERFDPAQFSLASFEDDPEEFWSMWTDLIAEVEDIDPQPNAGHVALAALEQTGHLDAILTQNADRLEQVAGAASDSVVELHGNAMQTTCRSCTHTEPVAASIERFDGASPPDCPVCGTTLKPDVVLFGEPLPREALRRARLLAAGCDLLLSSGPHSRSNRPPAFPVWSSIRAVRWS